MTRTPLVAANWKMNGRYGLVAELGAALAAADLGSAEVVVCPPFPYLQALGAELKDSGVGLGERTSVMVQCTWRGPWRRRRGGGSCRA